MLYMDTHSIPLEGSGIHVCFHYQLRFPNIACKKQEKQYEKELR